MYYWKSTVQINSLIPKNIMHIDHFLFIRKKISKLFWFLKKKKKLKKQVIEFSKCYVFVISVFIILAFWCFDCTVLQNTFPIIPIIIYCCVYNCERRKNMCFNESLLWQKVASFFAVTVHVLSSCLLFLFIKIVVFYCENIVTDIIRNFEEILYSTMEKLWQFCVFFPLKKLS